MHTVEMQNVKCPKCGAALDRTTNIAGKCGPKPGDFSICFTCTQTLRFTPEMSVEAVEMYQVPEDVWVTLDNLRFSIRMFRAAQN